MSNLVNDELEENLYEMFIEAGYTEKEALQQARVAHILRHGEYNKKTGKVKLWQIK